MYFFGQPNEQVPTLPITPGSESQMQIQTYVALIQAAAPEGLSAQIKVATKIFTEIPEGKRQEIGNELVSAGIEPAVVAAAISNAKKKDSGPSTQAWILAAAFLGVVVAPLGFALWRSGRS